MKKLDRKAIMTKAWAIYRIRKTSAFGVCLAAAWREHKLATMTACYEVVYRDTNEVKYRFYNESAAYRESETNNKVFFDQKTYVREVFHPRNMAA